MGFLGRLFGKKDEPDLEEPLGLEEKPVIPDMPPTELPPHLAEPSSETLTQPATPRTPGAVSSRDLELINSKLDTLKAILNSLDQRTANLEKAAGVEHKKMPW